MDVIINGLTLLTGIVGGVTSYFLLSLPGKKREERLEKSQAYLNLELASMEVFRYKAEHFHALHWAETGEIEPGHSEGKLEEEADQYFYQCLNLFEVCSRFWHNGVIETSVYVSWVAWFFETLEFSYFRRKWGLEYRDNYTKEIRDIFDFGVNMNWFRRKDYLRRDFYIEVSEICKRSEAARTRHVSLAELEALATELANAPLEPDRSDTSTPTDSALSYRWNEPQDIAPAAAFASATIAQAPEYISHGEIQTGLSQNGNSWAPNLAELYAEDFADPEGRDLLVGRDGEGRVRAILIIGWEQSKRLGYAVIEDMAVDPALRSCGVGGELLGLAEQRIRERDLRWVFLESGLGNERAHAFFERAGFRMTSHVFARHLD